MSGKIKTFFFSFITPFIIILVIITTSSLLINHLNHIQNEAVLTLYNWEKLISKSKARYTLEEDLSYEEYSLGITEFDNSIHTLKKLVPVHFMEERVHNELVQAITFWEYIKEFLSNSENIYKKLKTTRIGEYLNDKNISDILIQGFTKSDTFEGFDPYGLVLFSQLQNEFNVLIDFTNNESFFEDKLQSLLNSIESMVDLLIIVIIILSILFSYLVMFYGLRYIRQRLNEQKKRETYLSQILDSIGDAMIVLSEDQRIVKMNPHAELLLDMNFEDVFEKNLNDMISFSRDGSSRPIDPISDVYEKQEVIILSEDLIMYNNKGKEIYISSSVSPFFIGKKLEGVVFVFKDITLRRKQEKELINHKENLENLVKQRTIKLEESINELKLTQKQLVEAEKMSSLGELVAGVAHEINTPLGIALTSSTYISDQLDTLNELFSNNKLTKSSLTTITTNTVSSSSLLQSNLKKASKIITSFKQVAVDRTTEERREFNVYQYIEEILLSLKSEIEKTSHRINIICETDIVINSYPGAISQIMSHLILNSINHGFDGIKKGKIDITITKGDEKLTIHYSDTGRGINQADLQKIYEPFYTTKRNRGRSGLGMNIVYNLITQRLKGVIQCESLINWGTDFYIEFPHNMNS